MRVKPFRLTAFGTGSDRPRARWYDLGSGTRAERSLNRAAVEALIGSTTNIPTSEHARAGAELYRWLDGPTERWLDTARKQQYPIELRLDVEERLRGLPWELLFDDQFLATQPSCPIMVVREGSTRVGPNRQPLNRPLRVLFMASSPLGVEPVLDFEREEGIILDATKGRVDVVVEESGSLAGLKTVLGAFDEQFDVLHLSGHGEIGRDGPRLLMEDDEGQRHDASAADIATAIDGNWPRLVFVSGCETAGPPDAGAAASMAEELVKAGAPTVLGWSLPVGDLAASTLEARLYEELGNGVGILEAVTAARRALQADKNGFWQLLQLYADRSPLGPMVTRVGTRGRERLRDRAAHTLFLDSDGKIAVADRKSFVGRRRDMQTLLRELRPGDPTEGPQLALIHGMGGLGKSSLTARLLDRMRLSHTHRAVWVGQVDDDSIKTLTSQLTHTDTDTEQQINKILTQDLPLVRRLTYLLDGPLATIPCLFVFDNFEDGNLEPDGTGGYQCSAESLAVLKAFCVAIRGSGSPSRVIVTSRHSFPLPPPISLVLHGISRMSGPDVEKMLRLTKHLGPAGSAALDSAVRERAIAASAGLPRLIQTMDDTLGTIVSDEVDDMLAAVEKAEVEYREKLMLQQILAAQPSSVRRALALASIYQIAVPLEAMLALSDALSFRMHLQQAVDVGLIHKGLHPLTNETRYLVAPILQPLLREDSEKLLESDLIEAQRCGAKVLYRLWVDNGE